MSIVGVDVVVFEETGEKRIVVKDCQRCAGGSGQVVVSPTGTAHYVNFETTLCGHDATYGTWWWQE